MTERFSLDRRRLLTTAVVGAAAASPATSALAQAGGRAGGTSLPRRGEFVIRHAYVLTMDPTLGDLADGDIHVRDGEIIAIGANIKAPGAENIDARTMIALPGLIETHWHMWGALARNMAGDSEKTGYYPYSRAIGALFTPKEDALSVRLCLAEGINGGITTTNNWSHKLLSPAFADAELAVHREVGARSLFSYGYSQNTGENQILPLDDVARVQKQWFTNTPNDLLTLGIASRGPEGDSVDICRQEWETARKLGIRITCHMGTHVASIEKRQGVKTLAGANLLGPDVLLVHATNNSDEDFETLAKTKTPVSLSPYTEGRTGFGYTPTLRMMKAGVPLSLSVDTTILCGNADMFAIMKAIQNMANASVQSEFALPPRRVLQMATLDGAVALGLGDKIGSLKPGKRADIILVRTTDLNMLPFTADPAHMIVQAAQPANVDSVIVDGRFLKRKGKLTTIDVPRLVSDATETMQRLRPQIEKL